MVRTLVPSAQAARGGRLPDFVLVGAPKAGTTALHAALAQHPELFLSRVKEPKYYLCGDSPPPAYRGPGDAHSNREWVWRRQAYLDLFEGADEHQLTGESTPFYLCHRDARRRIAADLPDGQLAPVRDPERADPADRPGRAGRGTGRAVPAATALAPAQRPADRAAAPPRRRGAPQAHPGAAGGAASRAALGGRAAADASYRGGHKSAGPVLLSVGRRWRGRLCPSVYDASG